MAQTTIIPFSTLPACAQQCGPLFDVNGACVPPAAASAADSVYDACFCADARLAPFSTTTGGVCDTACTATPADYNSITAWYNSLCSTAGAAVTTTTNSDGSTSTGSASSSSSSSGGGGGWLSSHWQWVVFIIVMVVGIAGIWIGAAIWRRRYLRKKDRQYALGKTLAARTGSGQNPYGANGSHNTSQSQRSIHPPQPGMFMPATISSANVYNTEKPPKQKKKWIVRERT